ncbi:MAG: hypothetical protein RL885_19910 [Planctomycetota bacterium]
MSYDVYFVRREAGQSWDQAVEGEEDEERPWPAIEREELASKIRQHCPHIEEWRGRGSIELTDLDTGMQVFLYGSSAGMCIAYSHDGPDTERVMRTAFEVARIIEESSGLSAYDPQAGRGLFEGEQPEREAAAEMGQTSRALTEVDSKRWWQFWRRG